jgi:hypothetical protein
MKRREFIQIAGLAPLALGTSWSENVAAQEADSARKHANQDRKSIGLPKENDEDRLIEDALFGPTRNQVAPPPTVEHLPKADVQFAVFNDIHISLPDDERWHPYMPLDDFHAATVIQQINEISPDFAIHVGDSTFGMLIDEPFEEFKPKADRAKQFLSKITCPFYNMPGTHDYTNHAAPKPPDPALNARYETMRENYQKLFGFKDYYSFQKGDCYFILIPCGLFNTGQKVSDDVMDWLRQELKKSQSAKLRFVMTHEALFWRDPQETGDLRNHFTYLQPARSELLDLFTREHVDVVYSGHVHFEFANLYGNIYMHTLCAAVLTNPIAFFPFSRAPIVYPILPDRLQDPYQMGYLLVRIRNNQVHESWIPPFWRMPAPPPELSSLYGGRLVGRPATEVEDGALGLVADPPTPFTQDIGPHSHPDATYNIVNDHWWRVPEKVGAPWQQIWPPPVDDQGLADFERVLTLGRLRSVRVAAQLPVEPIQAGKMWSIIAKHKEAVSGVVVCNGAPELVPKESNPQLTSWRITGKPADWAAACVAARQQAPSGAKIVLGRLPLRPYLLRLQSGSKKAPDAMDLINQTAALLAGKADGLAVWMKTQGPPEEYLNDIQAAARAAKAHGLELWLDAVGWEYVDEPLRSAYFLRLLALCHATGVRMFWWNGPNELAGLIDRFTDPTPMFFAAQSWMATVDPPVQGVDLHKGDDIMQLRWRDRKGRQYLAWWRPTANSSVTFMSRPADLAAGSLVVDPLHARVLKIKDGKNVPLCNWPIIARSTA